MEKLISDVGGSFGLWIGWSIITVFEFLELCSDFIVLASAKFSRSHKNKHKTIKDKETIEKDEVKKEKQEQKTGTKYPNPEVIKPKAGTPPIYGSEYSDACTGGSVESHKIFNGSRCSSQHTLISNMTEFSSVSLTSVDSSNNDKMTQVSVSQTSQSRHHLLTADSSVLSSGTSTGTHTLIKKKAHPLLYV